MNRGTRNGIISHKLPLMDSVSAPTCEHAPPRPAVDVHNTYNHAYLHRALHHSAYFVGICRTVFVLRSRRKKEEWGTILVAPKNRKAPAGKSWKNSINRINRIWMKVSGGTAPSPACRVRVVHGNAHVGPCMVLLRWTGAMAEDAPPTPTRILKTAHEHYGTAARHCCTRRACNAPPAGKTVGAPATPPGLSIS